MFPSGSPIKRTYQAFRFDRNCVLAGTAGQIAAALHLDVPIAAILVGHSPYNVGVVARDIRLADTDIGPKAAIIASAGSVAFFKAGGMPVEELSQNIDVRMQAAIAIARALIEPWVIDWRLTRMIRRLDGYMLPGERTDLTWLMAFKSSPAISTSLSSI